MRPQGFLLSKYLSESETSIPMCKSGSLYALSLFCTAKIQAEISILFLTHYMFWTEK